MISAQVPTSLCTQDKLIMHSHHCFEEQYVYPRVSNIYMANLYLRDDQKWISFSLSCSLPLLFSPSLFSLAFLLTPCLFLFLPAFLFRFLSPVFLFQISLGFFCPFCLPQSALNSVPPTNALILLLLKQPHPLIMLTVTLMRTEDTL